MHPHSRFFDWALIVWSIFLVHFSLYTNAQGKPQGFRSQLADGGISRSWKAVTSMRAHVRATFIYHDCFFYQKQYEWSYTFKKDDVIVTLMVKTIVFATTGRHIAKHIHTAKVSLHRGEVRQEPPLLPALIDTNIALTNACFGYAGRSFVFRMFKQLFFLLSFSTCSSVYITPSCLFLCQCLFICMFIW